MSAARADGRDGLVEAGGRCDREQFAELWAETITGTSYVPWGPLELVGYLRKLADQLMSLVEAPDLDAGSAQRVGVDMVGAHFTGPETLGRSVAVLTEGLPGLLDVRPSRALTARVGQVVGELTAGYATALRDLALTEQEQMHRATRAAQLAAEQKLAVSEARFRAMFTEAAIGIGIADVAGHIQAANPALLAMLGYSEQQFVGRNVAELMHPQDAPSIWESYEQLVTGERDHFRVEKRFFRADGEVVWTNLTVSLVRDEQNVPSYQIAMMEDIAERRRLQSSLEHLAYHDPLTGLPNRALFSQRLAHVFAGPSAGRRIGLCFLDLDGFKVVNDSLGHDVGDQLLVAVASRLLHCCGPDRLVARMGGDEFVILAEDTSAVAEVVELADRILEALAAPLRLGSQELRVTASIGIVEKLIAATNSADLMSAADITLYWAKNDGKGRHAVYDRARTDHDVARFTLASAMPAAVEHGEFVLHYQPLVSLADGVVRGFEALVRWQHPTCGLLAPDRFIGVAEETGSIVPLGRWVLAQACRQARQWACRFGEAAPYVSVNLAARQLQDGALVDEITQLLHDSGVAPGKLQLELTEQAVMPDNPGPMRALRALNALGVRLAVDDFGTGYSNLSYLRQLPIHELKLDGSFVQGLRSDDGSDPKDDLLVSTLINLAHALDLTITAEGVETREQLVRLRDLGCDGGQGWYFARPAPADQIDVALLSSAPSAARMWLSPP